MKKLIESLSVGQLAVLVLLLAPPFRGGASRADFIVLDTDLLACPVDEIKNTKVLRTYLDGRFVCKQ